YELTAGRQLIVPGSPIILAHAPLGSDRPGSLEPVERFVQRRVLNLDHAIGAISDRPRHRVAMHRPPREGPQHEDVERALEQVKRLIGHGSSSPYSVRGRWRAVKVPSRVANPEERHRV